MEKEAQDDEGNNSLHELLGRADSENTEEIQSRLKRLLFPKRGETIEYLVNSRNIHGNTPLLEYMSCFEPKSEIIAELINHGADVNIADNLQMTALHKVTELLFVPKRFIDGEYLNEEKGIVDYQIESSKQIMILLLKAGANVNQADVFGRTPLFLANDINVIRTFLRYGADINITDKCGRTILLSALSMPNYDYLFDFYVSIMNTKQKQMSDIFASTPLHYAVILKKEVVFEKLLKAGGDINMKDGKGHTPTEIMSRRNPRQTVLHERHTNQENGSKSGNLRKVEIVRYTDITRNRDLSYAVQQPNNATDICEILNRPGLGAPRDEEESVYIKQSVNDLVRYFCHTMSNLDARMKCVLFPAGSSEEGTKVGDPTEFDFVFCLEEFANLCNVVEIPSKKGFAELKSKVNILPKNFKRFFDDGGTCNPTEIRLVFSKLLKRIVLNKKTWEMVNLYFDGEVKHLEEYDRPVFTLKIKWMGCLYKYEEISLDIAPAVRKNGWWPSDTKFSCLDMMSERIKREGCLLLLQNPYQESDTLFRISASPAEISLIKSFPIQAKEAYRLCKLLRHTSICPKMDSEPTFDSFPLFEADDSITSYMLKNCLFHSSSKLKKEGFFENILTVDKNRTIVDIAIRILQQFDHFAAIEALPVYSIPKRQDIFQFDFVEMDNIDDATLQKLNTFHCSRRRAFAKIMLYILGQCWN